MNTLQAGQLLGVGRGRVQQLIDEGRLKATNISNGDKRPRWNITEEDIADFIKRRESFTADLQEARRLHKEIIREHNKDEDKALLLEARLTFMEMKQPSEGTL